MTEAAEAVAAEPIENGEPVAKTPLSPDEYERRLQAQGRDLRDQRRQIRELNERLNTAGAQPQTKTERAAEPDLEADPIAWMKYAKTRLAEFDTQAENESRRDREQRAQQAQLQQISQKMTESEADFADDHADYFDAAAHFRKAREEELLEEGTSRAQLGAALQMDLANIVNRAIQAGKDPAQVIYSLAKRRGFGGVDASDKKLTTIARAQAAGKSLSLGGGSQGGQDLTYEYVSTLSGQALLDAKAKLRAQEKRRA